MKFRNIMNMILMEGKILELKIYIEMVYVN